MKKLGLLMVLLALLLAVTGCGFDQLEYYEVHLVTDLEGFRYVDPQDGKDTLSENSFYNEATYSIYVYQAEEGVTFDYTQFFSYLGDHQVYYNHLNGKYYIRATAEIDNLITEYLVARDAAE